jgi:hypothetical protein
MRWFEAKGRHKCNRFKIMGPQHGLRGDNHRNCQHCVRTATKAIVDPPLRGLALWSMAEFTRCGHSCCLNIREKIAFSAAQTRNRQVDRRVQKQENRDVPSNVGAHK